MSRTVFSLGLAALAAGAASSVTARRLRPSAKKGKAAYMKYGCWHATAPRGRAGDHQRRSAGAGPDAARGVHGVRPHHRSHDAALHARSAVERGSRRHARLSGSRSRRRRTTRAFRCSISRRRGAENRPGDVRRADSLRWRQSSPSIYRSSTSRSLLQPAQQIMTLVFEACSSSVRMASRCSGSPEMTRCSQAPQMPSSQE